MRITNAFGIGSASYAHLNIWSCLSTADITVANFTVSTDTHVTVLSLVQYAIGFLMTDIRIYIASFLRLRLTTNNTSFSLSNIIIYTFTAVDLRFVAESALRIGTTTAWICKIAFFWKIKFDNFKTLTVVTWLDTISVTITSISGQARAVVRVFCFSQRTMSKLMTIWLIAANFAIGR